MKIAITARSTIHHFSSGGMETHLKNLAEGLANSDNEVKVITTSFPKIEGEGVDKNNVHKIENGVEYIFIGDTTPGLNPLSKWEIIFYKLKNYAIRNVK